MRTSKVISGKSGGGRPKGGSASKQRSVVNAVGEDNYMPITSSRLSKHDKDLLIGVLTLNGFLKEFCNHSVRPVIKKSPKPKRKNGRNIGKPEGEH